MEVISSTAPEEGECETSSLLRNLEDEDFMDAVAVVESPLEKTIDDDDDGLGIQVPDETAHVISHGTHFT